MSRCPGCGIPARGWHDVDPTRIVIDPCGCWVTREAARPLLTARGDHP